MNRILAIKKDIIYGPVNSRRLGASLGINVFPGSEKLCSFDCLYCQYGWTSRHAMDGISPGEYPGADETGEALEKALASPAVEPAWLTLSGNGEASLHPAFVEIVERIISVRDRMAPSAKTAILSNSTTVSDEAVRGALARLDRPIMKLDCAVEELFLSYNRPCDGVKLSAVLDGLAELSALKPVTIQILLTAGRGGNYTEQNTGALKMAFQRIRPESVQIYTLHRGYPSAEIEPLGGSSLALFCSELVSDGLSAQVFQG